MDALATREIEVESRYQMQNARVKPISSWNSPRLLMAYAAFFFDVVVSIFSSRFIASRSLGRCR